MNKFVTPNSLAALAIMHPPKSTGLNTPPVYEQMGVIMRDTPILSDDQIRQFVSRITYKPGRELDAHNRTIHIRWAVPDRDGNDCKVQLRFSKHVPEGAPDLKFLEYFIMTFIEEIERHEMDEWFKVDGVRVRDPHAGDPTFITYPE